MLQQPQPMDISGYHSPENGHNLIFQGAGNSGGASLSLAIAAMAEASDYLYVESGMIGNPDLLGMAKAIIEMLQKKPAANRFLTHHFCFGVDKYLPGVSVYITMCRRPVKQLLSLYAYMLQYPDEFPEFKGASLEQFVDLYIKLDTNMTFSEFFFYHAMSEAQKAEYNAARGQGGAAAAQYMYDFVNQAYALTGVTELMEEYLVMISLLFMKEWPKPWVRNRQKKSKTPELEKSDPLYRKIEAALAVDVMLYDAFRTQFNALFTEFMAGHVDYEEKFLVYKAACLGGDEKIRAAFENGEQAEYLSDYIVNDARRLAFIRNAVLAPSTQTAVAAG